MGRRENGGGKSYVRRTRRTLLAIDETLRRGGRWFGHQKFRAGTNGVPGRTLGGKDSREVRSRVSSDGTTAGLQRSVRNPTDGVGYRGVGLGTPILSTSGRWNDRGLGKGSPEVWTPDPGHSRSRPRPYSGALFGVLRRWWGPPQAPGDSCTSCGRSLVPQCVRSSGSWVPEAVHCRTLSWVGTVVSRTKFRVTTGKLRLRNLNWALR